jgi:hypothetical protein
MPIVLLGILLSSCHTTTHVNRKSTFAPDRIELRINMSDLKLLGETEISANYSSYLQLFTALHEINGEAYDPTIRKITHLDGVNFGLNSKLEKAAYKIADEYPQAAYFQIVYRKKEVNQLFLGKEVKETALIRAYSLDK